MSTSATAEPITVSAGGVSVQASGQVAALAALTLPQLQADQVAGRLMKQDYTLWGQAAEEESKIRLGWISAPQRSRELLSQIAELVQRSRSLGLDHVVLAGMGGSSLAPEVITATAGVPLTTLDTTDPQQVRATLAEKIERTVVVVSSKSGTTIETDSHRRAYEQAFTDAGLDNISSRIIVVTDPGSALEKSARDAGYEVVLADPMVGGRYSALTAFGLVPSALAGVNVEQLLADAEAALAAMQTDEDNPGLTLGALLGAAGQAGRDQVLIADVDSGLRGFGDWAEQLIAESTGKEGKGLLPVVVPSTQAADFAHPGPHAHRVILRSPGASDMADELANDRQGMTTFSGPLGAAFVVWEYATAVASRLLGINPFDQPNVQEAKAAALALLGNQGEGAQADQPTTEQASTAQPPLARMGAVDVYADAARFPGLESATSLEQVVHAVVASVTADGYMAVLAYLDRHGQASLARLREDLAQALVAAGTNVAVTFGWGPRYLHSTGQYHKGGPSTGVFIVITGEVDQPVPVPGRGYSFAQLQLAQAGGDANALQEAGCAVIRLHLGDRQTGVDQLLQASAEKAR